VVDQTWVKTSTSTVLDQATYTYDRNGNRTAEGNGVNSAYDESYTYDGLNQLTGFDPGSGTRTQDFDYDALGNRESVTTNSTTQTYTANKQNEITSISGATTPTYDANGNMTTDETGRQFVYDAWNKLKVVKDSGGTTLKTYAYDGLGRRISETASGTTTDLYYSAQWQVLEERVGGVARASYVWSPVYVDAMIARDRDTDANGTLDERLYAVQDANFNVTVLVNASGVVVERYVYDSFGAVTVLDASWAVQSGGSNYAWVHLHQGGRYDGVSGLYNFRNRDYSATLGRWVTMDPMGYSAGDVNLYGYVHGSPATLSDPLGLAVTFTSIELRTTRKSVRGGKAGIDASYANLGPIADTGGVRFGFAITITATVTCGSKITDAFVNQEVANAGQLDKSAGGTTYTQRLSKADGPGKEVKALSEPYMASFKSGVKDGKYDSWGDYLTDDGSYHTAATGIDKAGIYAGTKNKHIEVTDTTITYDDFPGYNARTGLDPRVYKNFALFYIFRVTATDKGGASDGKSIRANFAIYIGGVSGDGKWTDNKSTASPSEKKWTDKV